MLSQALGEILPCVIVVCAVLSISLRVNLNHHLFFLQFIFDVKWQLFILVYVGGLA